MCTCDSTLVSRSSLVRVGFESVPYRTIVDVVARIEPKNVLSVNISHLDVGSGSDKVSEGLVNRLYGGYKPLHNGPNLVGATLRGYTQG